MTRTSENVRMNDTRLLAASNADAGLRLPPRMWTSLMTRTNCQSRRTCRATGQRNTRGTGVRTCPCGQ
jgi:hypothetical protein